MKYTESELKIIYQYSAENREKMFNRLEEIVPSIKDFAVSYILIKNHENKIDKKYLY